MPTDDHPRSREEMLKLLKEVEADERLHAPSANVASNYILVIEQVGLETRANTLRWALGMPGKCYHGRDIADCSSCEETYPERQLSEEGLCSDCTADAQESSP